MLEAEIIRSLKHAVEEVTQSALAAPQDKSEFGYGKAHGLYHGLTRAIQIVEDILNENERKEQHGKFGRGK